jgi:uncharacterized membrane protein YhaH (DUF805 family)
MLASSKGREDRASFWPYAALVLGIVMVAGALMSLPMMAWLIQATPQFTPPGPGDVNFAAEAGDFSIPAQGQFAGPVLPVGFLGAYLGVTLGLAVVLYAAAVVRRLHDRGNSGWWGAMPLPFLAYILVQVVRLFGSMDRGEPPDMTLLFTAAVANILCWATLLALVVLLAGPSDPRPNRYDLEGGTS